MVKLKVAVVTTSRADYGLLCPLLKKLSEDSFFELYTIVTGSHLLMEQGMTIEAIKKDGIEINAKVETDINGDTEYDICSGISKAMEKFSRLLVDNKPDLLILLGDRYELWAFAMTAVIHKLPIAHIHGGEATYGVIDEAIRHSVSKMSSIHFPSIDIYRNRIIQMGELPERVFTVGALGIDNIKNIDTITKEELGQFTGMDFAKDVALMTYHPVTLDDYDSSSIQIVEILKALLYSKYDVLITMPNADTGGHQIYNQIMKYVEDYPNKFKLFKSLGQKRYISALEHSKLMIGNSSSGIIESASFKIPVINIGDRQEGRYKPLNVIDCSCDKVSILNAINKVESDQFQKSLENLINPYGDGNTANKIVDILKTINIKKEKLNYIKKKFLDIEFCL